MIEKYQSIFGKKKVKHEHPNKRHITLRIDTDRIILYGKRHGVDGGAVTVMQGQEIT